MGTNDTRFVKPVAGGLVRYPGTKTQLPDSGASVPWTGKDGTYWRRREMDGSVIMVAESTPVEEKEQPSAPATESNRSTRRGER